MHPWYPISVAVARWIYLREYRMTARHKQWLKELRKASWSSESQIDDLLSRLRHQKLVKLWCLLRKSERERERDWWNVETSEHFRGFHQMGMATRWDLPHLEHSAPVEANTSTDVLQNRFRTGRWLRFNLELTPIERGRNAITSVCSSMSSYVHRRGERGKGRVRPLGSRCDP